MAESVLRGIGAAPGLALGPVLVYHHAAPLAPARSIDPAAVAEEQQRTLVALKLAQNQLEILATQVQATLGVDQAAIFEAQALMAGDPTLIERAAEIVAEQLVSAAAAVVAAAEEQARILESLDDAYLRERGADLRDVGNRAARAAAGEAPPEADHITRPSIIVSDDLSPSETAHLDHSMVLGLALSGGGPTSHVAVLARAMGVPLVCGLGAIAPSEGTALVDGTTGLLVLDPAPERIAAFEQWQAKHGVAVARQAELRYLPAETPDGRRVRLVANAGSIAEAEQAAAQGAEGIGLLRTEFLFLDHEPQEAEQVAAYSAIFAALPGREVVVRTMDLGGDKPPAYIDFGDEANPFLGWRGLRVALDRPEMLRTQLRALLRAGAGRPVHVMFPMVSTLSELRQAQRIVEETGSELTTAGVPPPSHLEIGIMIEVPAAALIADALAKEADFFSIGTNDLTQYTMAADRGSARVAALYSPIQPGVLRLIDRTVAAAHAADRWAGICGESAGNPAWAKLWLGLGLDELSMAPLAIPAVKEVIRNTTMADARKLAQEALSLSTLEEIEALLSDN